MKKCWQKSKSGQKSFNRNVSNYFELVLVSQKCFLNTFLTEISDFLNTFISKQKKVQILCGFLAENLIRTTVITRPVSDLCYLLKYSNGLRYDIYQLNAVKRRHYRDRLIKHKYASIQSFIIYILPVRNKSDGERSLKYRILQNRCSLSESPELSPSESACFVFSNKKALICHCKSSLDQFSFAN